MQPFTTKFWRNQFPGLVKEGEWKKQANVNALERFEAIENSFPDTLTTRLQNLTKALETFEEFIVQPHSPLSNFSLKAIQFLILLKAINTVFDSIENNTAI